MRSSLVVLLAVLAVVCADGRRHYDGDKVYRIIPQSAEQLHFVRQFFNAPNDQYDFWREPSSIGQMADLHVSAKSLGEFNGLMKTSQIPYSVIVDDVQRMINSVDATRRGKGIGILNTFPTREDTYQWLQEQCAAHSDITTCGTAGKTYENRTIEYIKIEKPSEDGTPKKKIMLEATIHAREWLTTATVISITNNLLNKYDKDPEAKRMVDSYDWIIVPIANPDGYEFTHTHERLWRKTRSQSSRICYGADPNRNWDSEWGVAGVSTRPCTDTYAGSKAFSEIETKTLSEFITANQENTLAYFSLHSYSQLWLIPFGSGKKPADYNELYRVAKIGGRALMDVNKTSWNIGNIAEVIYPATGGSIDWVKNSTSIKYSYCLELRPTQQNMNGFVVPPSQIEPSFREAWAGIVAAIDAMQK